jgi:two-component system, NarL family, response regulator NreC
MQTGNAVIIHSSPIIQQGLKNILLMRNIVISDILYSIPDYTSLTDWKDTLLLIDIRFAEELLKHRKAINKNRNTVFGIETEISSNNRISDFDEVLNINDNTDTILQKLNTYTSQVFHGRSNTPLSAREIEVLTMVAQGFSNKLIAGELFLSIHTVITHRKNITSKLGIKSISGLTLYAALNNMVDSHF